VEKLEEVIEKIRRMMLRSRQETVSKDNMSIQGSAVAEGK